MSSVRFRLEQQPVERVEPKARLEGPSLGGLCDHESAFDPKRSGDAPDLLFEFLG